MTDNEIIANKILCIRRRASGRCNGGTDCNTCDLSMNEIEIINAYQRAMKQNDLINRQKAEIAVLSFKNANLEIRIEGLKADNSFLTEAIASVGAPSPIVSRLIQKNNEKHMNIVNGLKAEIERLNIELQSMRSAANSYKMHYEKAQTEIERLQKNIDGLNIFTKNHIKVIRLQAIKEFAEKFAKALSEFDMSSVGLPDYDRGYKDCMTAIEDTIDNIVNKMT